jgi:hypothetical protein
VGKAVNKVFGVAQLIEDWAGRSKGRMRVLRQIQVFVRLSGVSYTSYRTIDPKTTQLGQLRGAFEKIHGGPITQESLLDENVHSRIWIKSCGSSQTNAGCTLTLHTVKELSLEVCGQRFKTSYRVIIKFRLRGRFSAERAS